MTQVLPDSCLPEQFSEISALLETATSLADAIKIRLRENRRVQNAALPVNRMPLEILVHILKLSCGSWRPQDRALKLTSVCHWWRHVVENTPSFWTTIDTNDVGGLVQKDHVIRPSRRPLVIQQYVIQPEGKPRNLGRHSSFSG